MKLKIKIHEKDADNNTFKKCVIITQLKGKEQELFESESVKLGIIPIEIVISEIPMMQASGSISTSTTGTSKKKNEL